MRGWRRRYPEIALALLFVVAASIHIEWVSRDASLMPHADPYVYHARVLRALDALREDGIEGAGAAIAELSLKGRPPVYQLLTIPIAAAFGRSEDVALGVNLLFGALLLVATFAIGRRCGGPTTGLLAAILVVSYPPIVQLARIYRPHFALPGCVALCLWLLLVMLETRSIRASWGFFLSLAFGMLVHPSFALAVAAPTAIFGSIALLFGDRSAGPDGAGPRSRWTGPSLRDPFVIRGVLPAAAVSAIPVVLWYLGAGGEIFDLFRTYSAKGVAIDGFEDVDSSFWWYVLTAPAALSYPFALGIAAGLVSALRRGTRAARVLALTLITSYPLLTLQPARAWWYFAALLPVAAVVTAAFVTRLRPHWLATALTSLCVALAAFQLAAVSWGAGAFTVPVMSALGGRPGSPTCLGRRSTALCPNPPRRESWSGAEIVARIVRDPGCERRVCRLVVAQRDFELSPVVLEQRLRRDWPGAELEIVPGQWAPPRVLASGDFILYVDAPQGSRPRRPTWTAFLRKRLPELADRYSEVAWFTLPDERRAHLIRRNEQKASGARRSRG